MVQQLFGYSSVKCEHEKGAGGFLLILNSSILLRVSCSFSQHFTPTIIPKKQLELGVWDMTNNGSSLMEGSKGKKISEKF